MKGLIAEGEEVLEHKGDGEPAAIDAALIVAAQKVEHYEISAYGSLQAFADTLGYQKVASLLQETLDEESQANKKLSELAEVINQSALEASVEGDDDAEDENSSPRAGMRGNSSRSRTTATTNTTAPDGLK